MRLLVANDIHDAARAPRSRKGDYHADIQTKLREMALFCRDNSVDVFCITGDYFNAKDTRQIPYWLIGDNADVLRSFNCRIIAALGNHDWDEVPENIKNHPIKYLYDIAGVEWLPISFSTPITDEWRIVVINSNDGHLIERIHQILEGYKNTQHGKIIVIAHAPIASNSIISHYPVPIRGMFVHAEDLVGIAKFIFYGDIHDPHGAYSIDGTTFVNFGSIARNNAHELNNVRPVCAAFLDTDIGEVQMVELENVRSASEAFNAVEIFEEKQKDAEIEAFIDSLSQTSFSVLTKDGLINRVLTAPELDDVEKGIAKNVIETAII